MEEFELEEQISRLTAPASVGSRWLSHLHWTDQSIERIRLGLSVLYYNWKLIINYVKFGNKFGKKCMLRINQSYIREHIGELIYIYIKLLIFNYWVMYQPLQEQVRFKLSPSLTITG